MAQEKEAVGSYKEFTENILPLIKEKGYNAIQIMALAEHPYYGSFGYHVSNFFAPSSRFGTPEDLKELIDEAHLLGITVIMDIVHSHTVKNINEGINNFDGSGHQYFHEGERGIHRAWDSRCFDYGKPDIFPEFKESPLTRAKKWVFRPVPATAFALCIIALGLSLFLPFNTHRKDSGAGVIIDQIESSQNVMIYQPEKTDTTIIWIMPTSAKEIS